MSEKELARRLRAIYDAMCERQEVVITFCLFAIAYRVELQDYKNKARVALCRRADLPDSYAGEIYKGQKLAPYVELTAETREWLRSLGSGEESGGAGNGRNKKTPPFDNPRFIPPYQVNYSSSSAFRKKL